MCVELLTVYSAWTAKCKEEDAVILKSIRTLSCNHTALHPSIFESSCANHLIATFEAKVVNLCVSGKHIRTISAILSEAS
jgi:hypothetical protein